MLYWTVHVRTSTSNLIIVLDLGEPVYTIMFACYDHILSQSCQLTSTWVLSYRIITWILRTFIVTIYIDRSKFYERLDMLITMKASLVQVFVYISKFNNVDFSILLEKWKKQSYLTFYIQSLSIFQIDQIIEFLPVYNHFEIH